MGQKYPSDFVEEMRIAALGILQKCDATSQGGQAFIESDVAKSLPATSEEREFSAYQIAKKLSGARETRQLELTVANIFNDPFWDILVDLYIGKNEAREMSFKNYPISSSSRPSTAARYLKILESEGLINQHRDETDSGKTYIDLTNKGQSAIEKSLLSYSAICKD